VSSADESARTIFVIRHAENPPDSPPQHGSTSTKTTIGTRGLRADGSAPARSPRCSRRAMGRFEPG
jgi:hypothetical protein